LGVPEAHEKSLFYLLLEAWLLGAKARPISKEVGIQRLKLNKESA
jgi:hypothetical protein